ncbi:MAG: UDP-N-acetylmuramoyl-L-alanyl-D-glutamate--2,6-diaminopimelate ligase [Tepidisphaeraceae bacterium]
MRLHSLLRHFDSAFDLGDLPNISIAGVQEDSRLVRAGDLFVARPGTHTDGNRFALDAQAKGAVAVAAESPIEGLSVPLVRVPNAAAAVSHLSNAFAGHPSRMMKVIGVTGTNGKTTTTYLIREILNAARHRCGMIGTVEIDDGDSRFESHMTTPGAVQVAELLAAMRANHCHACAIETSSHALDQHRVSGVQYAAAGFTNLTGDHLDYHKTMDAYAAAKAKLFTQLPPDAIAVVNADAPAHRQMIQNCEARVVTFGINSQADYRATDYAITANGTSFILTTPDGKTEIALKLVGRHNIENALCAIALCCETFGLSVHQVATALRTAVGAPGRLQPITEDQPFAVLVDYAHTDDALRNVLNALRPLTRGKLRLVFGCGGDRDRTKRPRMAHVAEQFADAIYVTSDNPRTEDPESILREIVSGFTAAGRKHVGVEVDRRTAIERALHDARPGDVVLIAGKGHENYQIVGKTKHHFDDVEEARRVLSSVVR